MIVMYLTRKLDNARTRFTSRAASHLNWTRHAQFSRGSVALTRINNTRSVLTRKMRLSRELVNARTIFTREMQLSRELDKARTIITRSCGSHENWTMHVQFSRGSVALTRTGQCTFSSHEEAWLSRELDNARLVLSRKRGSHENWTTHVQFSRGSVALTRTGQRTHNSQGGNVAPTEAN